MSDNIFYNDLHVHTNLSLCAPKTTTAGSYLEFCEQEGVRVLGFANHIYYIDTVGTGPKNAYALKKELDELQQKTDVKLLLGAEVEVIRNLFPSMRPEESTGFDYVLLAESHIANLSSNYPDIDFNSPTQMKNIIIENFHRACDLVYPVPAGICHPLYAIGSPAEYEMMKIITDSELSDCFSHAAKTGKSIEIHACLYRNGTPKNADGLSDIYLNMLSAAKAEGCKFHFGSDAHEPDKFVGRHKLLYLAAEKLGLSDSDIWQVGKI